MTDHPNAIAEVVKRADELYAERSLAESVGESVEQLRSIGESHGYDVPWRLSRAHFFLGQEATDDAQRRAQHRAGETAGRRAVRLAPDRVEGQFWSGVNLALQAPLVTPWRAVALALHAKRALARAIAIDPGYHGAGPHRVMGRLLHLMPQLIGGGPGRARKHFEAAIALDPANTVTRIYFAELLRDLGEHDAGGVQLQAVLDAKPDPAWEFEIARDQKLAREMRGHNVG